MPAAASAPPSRRSTKYARITLRYSGGMHACPPLEGLHFQPCATLMVPCPHASASINTAYVLQTRSVLPINCSCARQAGPPRQARPHEITCALHQDAQGARRDVEEKLKKLVWGGRPCAGRQRPDP